ncbi:MAG: flagellar hook assembly protein FlgD, partial [Lentimonas sp.]
TPRITKLDGHGNGGRALKLTAASENTIVANGFMANPEYDFGGGPINVKVVDPLNLADGYFECEFNEFSGENQGDAADTASWTIKRYASKGGQFIESVSSSASIDVDNEQLIPKWGVSVQIYQTKYYFEKGITGNPSRETTDVLSADLTYTDSSKQWMSLIPDVNGFFPLNWIRSGTNDENLTDYDSDDTYSSPICYNDEVLVVSANEKYSYDPDARWSSILNGGFAPHRLVGYQCDFMPLSYFKTNPSYPEAPEGLPGQKRDVAGLAFSPSIDIVLTTDKSKWTRCPVIELGRDKNLNIGGALPGGKRKSTSVNKNGVAESSGTGMGWFPGYAIDIESGARLYMAFGENSFLGNDNGSDMIWNPSSRLFDNVNTPVMAGQHAIYVFSYKSKDVNGYSQLSNLGAYKESNNEVSDLLDLIESGNPSATKTFYTSLTWIGQPFLTPGQTLLSSDARIQIRVNKEYRVFSATGNTSGKPKYSWDMSDIATKTGNESELANALQLINVVPNPYYAFSEYERGRLDNRVKITNLPEECTITIYSINGKLVRTFKKASPITSIDWDLNNKTGIPIASGVYLIHVSVPDVGDVVVKFFAGIREVDLQGL